MPWTTSEETDIGGSRLLGANPCRDRLTKGSDKETGKGSVHRSHRRTTPIARITAGEPGASEDKLRDTATIWSFPTTMLHRGAGIIGGITVATRKDATMIMWKRASTKDLSTESTTRTILRNAVAREAASPGEESAEGSDLNACLLPHGSCRRWASQSNDKFVDVPATITMTTTLCMEMSMATTEISCPRIVLCPFGCASSWSLATSLEEQLSLPTGRAGPSWILPISASSP